MPATRLPGFRPDGLDGERRGRRLPAGLLVGGLSGVGGGGGAGRLGSGRGRAFIKENEVRAGGEQDKDQESSEHGLRYAHSHLRLRAEI